MIEADSPGVEPTARSIFHACRASITRATRWFLGRSRFPCAGKDGWTNGFTRLSWNSRCTHRRPRGIVLPGLLPHAGPPARTFWCSASGDSQPQLDRLGNLFHLRLAQHDETADEDRAGYVPQALNVKGPVLEAGHIHSHFEAPAAQRGGVTTA